LYPRSARTGNVRSGQCLGALDVARGHNAANRGIALTLEPFLSELADRTAAPGGGAAAAAACAVGAALAEMAARFAGRDEDAARAAALRADAVRLGEEDLTAYAPVLEARRLPREDPARGERIAAASAAAADVPLAVAETAAAVAELARDLARTGKRSLVGDALAGADIAAGAAAAAARLVAINLAGARSDPRVARARTAADRAAARG
jgi:formiminotetrahydrofolate cyclodeaminase